MLAPSRSKKWMGPALLLLVGAIFFLYSYNSGYGFDGLDYLVIGRSLVDGFPMYFFIPSKSPGLYALIASMLSLGVPQTHFGVSLIIVVFFMVLLLAAWFVAVRLFDRRTAIAACALIVLSASTMELNFLEPEGLVAASGLLAAWLLYQGFATEQSSAAFYWLAAGLAIGAGCCLKTVAAFYWLGGVAFIGWLLFNRRTSGRNALLALVLLSAGSLIPQAAELLYFSLTGRLQEFLLWTYTYPLLYFPPETTLLRKLFIKCGWLVVVVAAAWYCARAWGIKNDSRRVLILAMAAAPLLSLLKTQASHYLVPSAVFLAIYAGSIFAAGWEEGRFRVAGRPIFALVVLFALVNAGLLAHYRPDVVRRFTRLRDYSWERGVSERITASVGPDDRILAFRDALQLYWLSKRYPPGPFIDTERQAMYWLRTHPDAFTNILAEPHLTLVAVDPADPGIDDPNGMKYEYVRSALVRFTQALPDRFEPTPVTYGYQFWIPRQ